MRHWLRELARMPTEWIHHPWDAPKSVLEAAGVELGVNYPKPIVELDTARERLDDAVAMMWELDRAARIARLKGAGEVIADNLLGMEVLDIPKVVVKKDVSTDASSCDQRVPSVQNFESSSPGKRLKRLAGKSPKGAETNNHEKVIDQNEVIHTSKMDEDDLLSTAESSTTRKRNSS